jgi:uncharacterized protein YecA (UPF0149 family)
VPALLEILQDETLALPESSGGGWAPVHAAELLGELRTAEAIGPMIGVLAKTDPLDILRDQVRQSLPKIGATVIEPALRAAKGAHSELQDSLAAVLARIGSRDERIFEILLDQLRRDPTYAGNLAIYGDPRAVPYLLEALDKHEIIENGNPLANHDLIELRAAIEELGGTLTAEQQRKCQRGRRQAEAALRAMRVSFEAKRHDRVIAEPVRRHDPIGRNDPCWCGSGKKYKKCHLGSDENRSSS